MPESYAACDMPTKRETWASEAQSRLVSIKRAIVERTSLLTRIADNAYGARPEAECNAKSLVPVRSGQLGEILNLMDEIDDASSDLGRAIDRLDHTA